MLSGVYNIFNRYILYPLDIAFLTVPFWEGVDHALKVLSILIAISLALLSFMRYKRDMKSKDLDDKIKEAALAERLLKNKKLLKDDDR
jgi:hypothetical protein